MSRVCAVRLERQRERQTRFLGPRPQAGTVGREANVQSLRFRRRRGEVRGAFRETQRDFGDAEFDREDFLAGAR